MNSKEYLSRAFRLDRKIKSKIDQIAEMKALATKVSVAMSDIRVQTSKNDHRLEDIMIKIMEYQNELCDDMERLVEIKKETKKAIDSVSNDEQRLVLEMRYLLYMRWEEIAVELEYTVEHIYRIHRCALHSMDIEKIV